MIGFWAYSESGANCSFGEFGYGREACVAVVFGRQESPGLSHPARPHWDTPWSRGSIAPFRDGDGDGVGGDAE